MNREVILESSHEDEIYMYIEKLKESPKLWSLKRIYDLWKRTLIRHNKLIEQRSDYIDQIIKLVPPDDYGEIRNGQETYTVYDEELYTKVFKYVPLYKCYSVSNGGKIGNSGDVSVNRNYIIDFLSNDNIRLKMGIEYNRLDNLSNSRLHIITFNYLWEIIKDKLKKMKIEDNVFDITICGDEYYIITNNDHSLYGYNDKYKLVPKTNREKIEFN